MSVALEKIEKYGTRTQLNASLWDRIAILLFRETNMGVVVSMKLIGHFRKFRLPDPGQSVV